MLEEGSATDAAADVASDAMVTSAAKKPAAKHAKRSASKNNATAAAANKKQKPGGGQTTLSQYACTARHAARADVLEASSVRPKRKGAGTGGASERYAKDDERGTERQKIVQDGGGGEWANAMVVGPVRTAVCLDAEQLDPSCALAVAKTYLAVTRARAHCEQKPIKILTQNETPPLLLVIYLDVAKQIASSSSSCCYRCCRCCRHPRLPPTCASPTLPTMCACTL